MKKIKIEPEREFPDALFEEDFIFEFLELETIFTEEFVDTLRELSNKQSIRLIRYENLEPVELRTAFSFTTNVDGYLASFKKEMLTDYFENIKISPYQISEKGLLTIDDFLFCLLLRRFGVAIVAFRNPSLATYFEELSIASENLIPYFESQLGNFADNVFISKLAKNWNIKS